MSSIEAVPNMKAKVLTIMATRSQDQKLVDDFATAHGLSKSLASDSSGQRGVETRVVPCFGWHPWFSHQMFDDTMYLGMAQLEGEQKMQHYRSVLQPDSDDWEFFQALPNPLPISQFIKETRQYLDKHPLALVGEIGLDRSFRIPEVLLPSQHPEQDQCITPGGREGRRLSSFRVSMEHQRKVLKAQLLLAGEMQRAVSVHGVQSHGILFDTLAETWKGYERKGLRRKDRKMDHDDAQFGSLKNVRDSAVGPYPFPPRICLHSYSGPTEPLKQYLHASVPADIFFSFSTLVNFSSPASSRAQEVIKLVPANRILVESDLHSAGDLMDELLEDVTRRVCKIKGWSLEDGVKQLGQNWKHFVFGSQDANG